MKWNGKKNVNDQTQEQTRQEQNCQGETHIDKEQNVQETDQRNNHNSDTHVVIPLTNVFESRPEFMRLLPPQHKSSLSPCEGEKEVSGIR